MASPGHNTQSALLLLLVTLLASLAVSAQTQKPTPDTEDRRSIWPPDYRQETKVRTRPARYRRTSKTPSPAASAGPGMLGVTIWRLRPSKPADEARILVTKNNSKSYWTPERVSADTPFNEGQLVRLSVEVPRTGFLYVIDRELYADGTSGDPYLIFPLSQNGEPFKVARARIVELPGAAEDTPGFEFNSYRKDGPQQTAELLTFIISPSPLPDLRLSSPDGAPVKLARTLAEELESHWASQAEQLELDGGAGRNYTPAEKNAAHNRALSNADPLPQTVFRLTAKPGSPFAIKLPLRIAR